MSHIKPILEQERVISLLASTMGEPIADLEVMHGGQIAQVFAFTAASGAYIVRFNTEQMAGNLAKEAYIASLAGPAVPIPRILHMGRFEDLEFAVSERVPGLPLDKLSPDEYTLVIPSLIETLWAIHRVDVSTGSGYGYFDATGRGGHSSWREFLASVIEEQPEGSFYGKWHALFEDTFLEREVFDTVYQHMLRLLDYCPEERHLVHADYGWGNVIAQDGQVTGVLDWANAIFGDFIFDIAWLALWSPADHNRWQDALRQDYLRHVVTLPHYAERLLCYQYNIALDSMRFYARTHQRDSYTWIRGWISDMLRQ
jgi:hygromycin-B 4-O-kinase